MAQKTEIQNGETLNDDVVAGSSRNPTERPDPSDEAALRRWREHFPIQYDEVLFDWIREELEKLVAPLTEHQRRKLDHFAIQEIIQDWAHELLDSVVRHKLTTAGKLRITELLMDFYKSKSPTKTLTSSPVPKEQQIKIFRFVSELFMKQDEILRERDHREMVKKKNARTRWRKSFLATQFKVDKKFTHEAPLVSRRSMHRKRPESPEKQAALSLGTSQRLFGLSATCTADFAKTVPANMFNEGRNSPFDEFRRDPFDIDEQHPVSDFNPYIQSPVSVSSSLQPRSWQTAMRKDTEDDQSSGDWGTRLLVEARSRNGESLASPSVSNQLMLPQISTVPAPPSLRPGMAYAPPIQDQQALKFPEVIAGNGVHRSLSATQPQSARNSSVEKASSLHQGRRIKKILPFLPPKYMRTM